jgi:ribosomal-protein-alanine N-acetyltransferase
MDSREVINIREMKEEDLDEVLQIERSSFPTPWSRLLFQRELSTPFARSFIGEEVRAEKILGYLCFWLVDQEAHILNLAVHPERRNLGIGTRLLGYGVDYCRKKGAEEMILEVRRSNYKAISLYRNFHFQPRGIRRKYYTDSGEDAVVMGLHLGDFTPLITV